MKRQLLAVLGLVLAMGAAGAPASPAARREIDNVAAFARAYGVIRYFYPSDAAAALDWNRFVVHGTTRVRAARDKKSLQATLQALFAPLGPGIEIGGTLAPLRPAGDAKEPLVAWRYLGAGLDEGGGFSAYSAGRTNRSAAAIDGIRGKTIRLRAQVRAAAEDPDGWAALWVRVDRPLGAMGFFDNMQDRKIRERQWREYSIQGAVAEDALALSFGAMASGKVTADFDAVELCVQTSDGCAPVPIRDAGFEAELQSRHNGWPRAGTSKTALVSRVAADAPEGRQFLRFEPPALGAIDGFVNAMQVLRRADPFLERAATAGEHADAELGSGLKLRVPLTLGDGQARVEGSQKVALEALSEQLVALGEPSREPDLDRRLADVVVAWNVYRHFFPYSTETGVDWDARLTPLLEAASAAETRAAQRDVVRLLVADVRDGHGFVGDTLVRQPRLRLPVQLGVIEEKVVITASGTAEAPVGAVVAEIDGSPATRRLAEEMRLASGSEQWRRERALRELTTGAEGTAMRLGLDSGTKKWEATLRYELKQPPPEKRPEPTAELEPQLWYVDLTRATMADLRPLLESLAKARCVVFDVRGYPTDAGAQILGHLVAEKESDRWMHIAELVGPFGQAAGWRSLGWNVGPTSPRIAGKIAFLTDGRAISYAESVMGYVGDRKLGTIVGGATAGTNGNVATFNLPSGFSVGFTGMRVTRHDGQTPFHLIGVQPDVPATPTIAGLRSGRDEVLQRAVEIVRGDRDAVKP